MQHTDQQQWQQLLQWLKKNAVSIATIVVIGGGGSLGWNLWKATEFNTKAEASVLYEQVKQASLSGDFDQAKQILQQLQSKTKTDYAVAASLVFSNQAYQAGQTDSAISQLHWIIDNSNDEINLQLAADRLARLLLDQKQPDKAIEIAQSVTGRLTNPSALSALNMVIGDSHLFKKQYAAAIDFYNTAKKNLPDQSPLRELIEMKIESAQSF